VKNEAGNTHNKRGYLNRDFELFHIKDQKNLQFEFHYHDFNKIIIFISGKVTYLIEGKAYRLKPWDVLLISSREVHKPIIDAEEVYERIVLWVNTDFLTRHSNPDCDLSSCFDRAYNEKFNLIRFDPSELKDIRAILSHMEEACKSNEFGSHILKNSLFMQFIVQINRKLISTQKNIESSDIEFDESISSILDYINENLGKDLSIEHIASRFFMSKYYLMHKFKNQTGYSLYNYILQKRLIAANELIKKGVPAMETSIECGFGDYSSFVRAFKKMFGSSPKKYYMNLQKEQKLNEKEH